jgi:hypothetical protein
VCEKFRETKQIKNHGTFVLKGKSIDCINCDSGNAYGGMLDPISEASLVQELMFLLVYHGMALSAKALVAPTELPAQEKL